MTDTWLFEHVVPHIRARYSRDDKLCQVLGLSLLYICLSSNEQVIIPEALSNRVKGAYAALGLDEDQPVEKVELHVYRMPNGTFGISDVVPTETTAAAGPQQTGGPMTAEMGQTLLVRMNALEQAQIQMNLNLMSAISESRAENRAQLRIVNNNVRAYGGTIQGSLVRQRPPNRAALLTSSNQADEDGLAPLVEVSPATLSNNPRSLLLLWQEYKFGINGRKAAEQFSTAERNIKSNKQKYYRRNLVWQTIARLVRGGLSAEVAIERINRVYGYGSSTTKIIETMVKDKRRYPGGIHPNLS